MSTTEFNVVCFGVEVSSFLDPDSDVLQIAMKCGHAVFNEYIDPTKPIPIERSAINHLTVRDWHLYRNGVLMPSRPLRTVLQRLLDFLKQFKQPSILICHQRCMAGADRLVRVIRKESMETEFRKVILGFRDTYDMFKKKFPTREHRFLTLHLLAAEAHLKWSHSQLDGRCVKHCAALLEKLTLHHFAEKDFTVRKSFSDIVERLQKSDKKAERRKNQEAEEQHKEQVEAEKFREEDEKQEETKEKNEEKPKPEEVSTLT